MEWVELEGILKIFLFQPNTFHSPGCSKPHPPSHFQAWGIHNLSGHPLFLTLLETFPFKLFLTCSGFASPHRAAELWKLHNSIFNLLLVAGWNFPRGWRGWSALWSSPAPGYGLIALIWEWNNGYLSEMFSGAFTGLNSPLPTLFSTQIVQGSYFSFILQTCLASLKLSLLMLFMALENQRGQNKNTGKELN